MGISFLGLSGVLLASFIAAALMLITYLGFPYLKKIPLLNLIYKVPQNIKLIGAIALFGFVAVSAGWLANWNVTPATIAGTVASGGVVTCSSSERLTDAGCIPSDLFGTSVTVKFNGADYGTEARASATTVPTIMLDKDGVVVKNGNVTDSTGVSVPAGSIIDAYVVGSTYPTYYAYPSPMSHTLIKVNGEKYTFDIEAVSMATATSMSSALWDVTGQATALSAADNTTLADSKIPLSANQSAKVRWVYQNKNSGKAYDLDAMAITYWNNTVAPKDIADDKGGVYSTAPCPNYITDDTNVLVADASATSATWKICYQRNEPLRLNQYDTVSIDFIVTGGSTDPASSATFLANGYAFQALDSAWYSASDGSVKYGFATDGTSTANVGISEATTSPLGSQDAFVLQVT